ncbi:hydroxyethylthiazole kinase [Oceanidesulfovibrio indonesiensis]|uniref:Hydroxyethylthiazole kinase n=1 Tax=Oceanidesulfovibrio indonesiensis TaxID=54767 RepID=A0A7M3MFK8_9BACT|nr:hydroxyethylthiazole kinase [Oceanidesulfovibrio indonesiensis]TVM17412.1 hydroxyethylthiazole kinase [Oceanidesulfovibrio indonesiensis]
MITTPQAAWRDVEAIREQKPLVVNVTNYVVMNNTANALLAIGASPAMTNAVDEMEDIVALCQALVLNMGTPTPTNMEAMAVGFSAACELGKPVVFDPVAVGATRLRRRLAASLMENRNPSIIRGNASEILALAGSAAPSKGADTAHGVHEASDAAAELAKRHSCTVCVSGEIDLITDGSSTWVLTGGHPMMPYVTGLGCTASALCGAFAAVNPDPLAATIHAMAAMGAAGEIAAARSQGPGSLQMHLYDVFYGLTETELTERMRLEAA